MKLWPVAKSDLPPILQVHFYWNKAQLICLCIVYDDFTLCWQQRLSGTQALKYLLSIGLLQKIL